MPSPTKSIHLMTGHISKEEKEKRKAVEAALFSGRLLGERNEVKNNPIAHKEFERLSNIFAELGKSDALIEQVLNRYCLLTAEVDELLNLKNMAGDIKDKIAIDKQLMTKRRMMFDIERENIMTVYSALRSIPKKEPPREKDEMELYFEEMERRESNA